MTVGIRDAEDSIRRVYCLKSRTRGFVHAVAKKHAVCGFIVSPCVDTSMCSLLQLTRLAHEFRVK